MTIPKMEVKAKQTAGPESDEKVSGAEKQNHECI